MENTEKMIEKIKKVMELAERGSTEAERDTAMLQAQKLLDKYNISMSQIDTAKKDKKYIEGEGIRSTSKGSLMENVVTDIIGKYYNVEIIISNSRDAYGFKERTLRIFGQKHNVTVACYMHNWLSTEFDQRWNDYKTENSLKGTKHKSTYIFGLYSGLDGKLQSQREELVKEYTGTMDVAVLDETALILNWLKSQMDIKDGKKGKVNIVDGMTFAAGQKDGASISLNTQVGA